MDISIFDSFDLGSHIDELADKMPQFVFYRRGKKYTDCYCTACRTRYTDEIRDPKIYKHKKDGTCKLCDRSVEFRQMDRGRSTYYHAQNFAILESCGDTLLIECVRAYQEFVEDIMQPDIVTETVAMYALRHGEAGEYVPRFDSRERAVKFMQTRRTHEPSFCAGLFGGYDNSYTLINYDSIRETDMRYIFDQFTEDELPRNYIVYLCRYAEHPQLEYLVKGGFKGVADAYVDGALQRERLNWRSNDLKKILRIDRNELEYLRDWHSELYVRYMQFRRDIYRASNSAETIKYFEDFGFAANSLHNFQQITKLPHKRVMDYLRKQQNEQGLRFIVSIYRDYLDDCSRLDYDLSDEQITLPRDLFAAHDRAMRAYQAVKDQKSGDMIIKSDKELRRRELLYTDDKHGLILTLPVSATEIVTEGKVLSHCVAGYADRHCEGKLTIAFIRKKEQPNVPYYTIEISNTGKIVQCHGYHNEVERFGGKPKPQEIIEFEEEYAAYLEEVFDAREKEKKKSRKKLKVPA